MPHAQPIRPFRLVIAPFMRQAQLFIQDSGYHPHECRIATRREDLRGYDLRTWETWFLQGMWPCRTHEDVQRMEAMEVDARVRGADLRRWGT